MHSIGFAKHLEIIKVSALRSDPSIPFERVHKTEGCSAPRPDDGASGPPKFQPIG